MSHRRVPLYHRMQTGTSIASGHRILTAGKIRQQRPSAK